MDAISSSPEEKRAQLKDYANEIGVTEDYISVLVDSFYGKVRDDPEIGPIFETIVQGNWSVHLARMKDFWASVALGAGRYSGRPVPKHFALKDLNNEHFAVWLGLFRQTLEETAPSPEAIPYFMERAERIAKSLQLAIFGVPGIPKNTPKD